VHLDHQFTVAAPVDEVWRAVLDPERVAPCMPGATLSDVDGDTFRGTVKVKLGPIALTYKGAGEFVERDDQAHRVVIKASGKDARGGGTAAATVTVTLTGHDGGTDGTVATELNVTGKPAQFGRGLIGEVGGKLLDQFAGCLGDKLAGPAAQADPGEPEQGQGGEPEDGRPELRVVDPPAEPDSIDLVDLAGGSVGKRLAPVAGALAALVALVAVVRALRR
jgi:carbon monoxide dehydrogenase subunit G